MQEEAKLRVKIVTHYQKYGLDSTLHAFNVKRATIFRYQKILKENPYNLSKLNNKSRKPKKVRKRIISNELKKKIIELREKYPRIGQKMIYHLIKEDFQTSISTIGRIIKDLKENNELPIRGQKIYKKKKKTIKLRRKERIGVEIDTVVRHIDGNKWYFVNAIDIQTRKAYSTISKNHSSISPTKLLSNIKDIEIKEIQSDNGSEFQDHFHKYCEKNNILHYFTYPKSPKMNIFIERFNKTLNEEFIIWNRELLCGVYSIEEVNTKLQEYMSWYNNERPHTSLGFVSPNVWYNRIREKV